MLLEAFADYFSEFVCPWYMPSVDEYSAVVKARTGRCASLGRTPQVLSETQNR
jgi:hypothetical protein